MVEFDDLDRALDLALTQEAHEGAGEGVGVVALMRVQQALRDLAASVHVRLVQRIELVSQLQANRWRLALPEQPRVPIP